MTAVAPQTDRLSPYSGRLRDEVSRCLGALLGAPQGSLARIERLGTSVVLHHDAVEIVVENVSPQARQEGRSMVVRLRGGTRSARAALQSAVSASAGQRDRMTDLARALDAWWPFADLPDEEFRKISSAPTGPYGTLRLGYRCNQDCWFCWQDRKAASPPEAMYWQWLEELAAEGVQSLNITGGEATTWPVLAQIVRRAAAVHRMTVSLQTNAVRLANADYTRSLVEAGLQVVMVSLHSADPEVSDRMTRAPGTHRRTLAGIEQALLQGLRVTLTCVVEEANHQGLVAHAQLVRDDLVPLGPAGGIARVTYAHPTSYSSPGAWEEHQLPFDQVRAQLSEAVALLRAAGIPVQVGGPCGFPVCALDPTLVPDPYQVLERSVFSPEELQHRRFAPVCVECRHQSRCFGLRQEYLDRFGGQGLRPS